MTRKKVEGNTKHREGMAGDVLEGGKQLVWVFVLFVEYYVVGSIKEGKERGPWVAIFYSIGRF